MASVTFTCPECAKVLRSSAPPPAGKKVKCPDCGHVFLPELAEEEKATSIQERPRVKAKTKMDEPPRKKTRIDDEEDTGSSRKKRRRDDDDDDDNDDLPIRKKKKAKKKSGSMMLIVLLVLGGGGLLVSCAACGVGAFVWPGFLTSKSTELAAFVAPDANLVMGGNPKLMRTKFSNLENLLRQQGPFGQPNRQKLDDISLNSERMLAFGNTKDFENRSITVFISTAADIDKVKRNPALGQAQTIGGHANVHKQAGQAKLNGLPRIIAFPGNNIVVTTDGNEQDLIAALNRSKQGAQPNAALALGRSVEQSPFWMALVPDADTLAKMRQQVDQGGAMMPAGLRNAGPAFGNIKGLTVTFDAGEAQDLKINANVHCKSPDDAAKIKTGIDDGWGMLKGLMQLGMAVQRPGQPQIPPTLMGDLNSLAFAAQGSNVTGTMKVSAQTMQDLAKLGGGQMFPGPGPINPPPVFPQPAKDVAQPAPAGKKTKTRIFTATNIAPGQFQERTYTFQQGRNVSITMTSSVTDKATDVDLYVFQGVAGEMLVIEDTSIGPNGSVSFVPPVTGSYRVRVRNLGPGNVTSSLVTITER